MSGRKDRERAESGLIFRDGHLVRKEVWYAAHPTKEMLAVQRVTVKSAVKDELAKKFAPELPSLQTPEPKPYFCSKCGHEHKVGTKIYEAHKPKEA
jgi:hypothetical protein